MDLALPRFAGLGDGPLQVHALWEMSTDSPASPAASRLDTAGLASPCLDLDGLSSSDDDIGTSVGLSDPLVTLLCGSDEVFSPVNSDQVLLDVDFPPEPVSLDKQQVVRIRDASPNVLLVDAPPVHRTGDPRRSVARVPSGKRMPGGFHDTLPSSSLVGYDCYVRFWGCSDVHATAGGHSCSGHEDGHCYQSRGRCLSGTVEG